MFHSWRLWNLCWLQNFGVSPRALAMKPNARAQQVQADTEKRAHNLDLKYPGSTFTQVLKSHGKDGRYLVLVVGPFANLSDDSIVLWGLSLLGRARALKAIYSWNISAMHALAINRHILVSQFGHLASLVWTIADSRSFSWCGVARFFSISCWFQWLPECIFHWSPSWEILR